MKLCPNCGDTRVDGAWNCQACGTAPRSDSAFIELAPHLASHSSGFKPEYFERLARVEEGNFWFRARNRLICSVAAPFMKSGASYCEVGCGTGYVLAAFVKAFPSVKFSATEIYSDALSFASERSPTASLYQMDARAIPFSAEFDAMGTFDVLEHIEEDETVLSELHRALKPKGTLLITVPQHRFLWSQQDEHACHVRRYTRKEIQMKLQRAGFRVAFSTSFVSLLLPAMYLSRQRSRVEDAQYDFTSDLQLSRPVNAIMTAVMAIEYVLIRLGVRFPFGGSLLIVAQKTD